MHKRRIFVGVVGFSDVERHALNTVFRLSEDCDLAYEPWLPSGVAGAQAPVAAAQALLVDGQSAEAVLTHAREMPTGQRLIWFGVNAPSHAWRVQHRPIVWSRVLRDLEAVHAACQVDSGLLDLDITLPAALVGDAGSASAPARRALLVGVDAADTQVLRAGLVQAHTPEIDVVSSTEMALALMGRNAYSCAVFNLDEHRVDAWALARLFSTRFPQATCWALSERGGGLWDWWSQRRLRRSSRQAGMSTLLVRPLQARALMPWIDRL